MQIQTVSTAARRRSVNTGQYTPTVLVTDAARQAIANGDLNLKRGQWVVDGSSGVRGQVRGVVTKNHRTFLQPNKVEKFLSVRPYKAGLRFSDYQQGV